ncbi:MAG TPA: hypothetical protein VK453_18170 [Micromonosporaceae bacterium]|nr:hypothetical protein [Micromonosporaceae bacterium]
MSNPSQPGADDDRAAAPAGVPPADGQFAADVAALTEDNVAPATRRQILGRMVARQARARGIRGLFRPKTMISWIADSVGDVAPYIPVRDLATLREHHDGLEGDALAERLIRNAARVTTGIGAAGGGVAAVEWVVTPTLLSAPVLLATETVAVVAVEVKLIGELHEVYGRAVPGTGTQRALHLVQAWAQQRGVNPLAAGRGVSAALGTATRKELRDRLVRRFGRNLSTMGPFLTGAAVAGFLNRRSTLSLGEQIRKDLIHRPKVIDG